MNASSISIKKWGIALISLLLLFEFVFFPWLDWLDSNQQELQGLKKIVAKQEYVLASNEQAKASILQLEEQLKAFENIPVLKKNQDPALLWLQVVDSAVARFEVDVNNKAPFRQVEINDSYAVYAGQLNVSGDYNKVLNLLYDLENINVGNRIRQVSLIQDKALIGKVSANIEFVRVFRKL